MYFHCKLSIVFCFRYKNYHRKVALLGAIHIEDGSTKGGTLRKCVNKVEDKNNKKILYDVINEPPLGALNCKKNMK